MKKKTLNESKTKGISETEFKKLLFNSNKMKLFLEKELESISFGSVILFIVKSNNYSSLRDALLKKISVSNSIYLTVNKPALFLKKRMHELNISSEKIFFIDMITALTSNLKQKEKGISFIGEPSELVESILEVDNKLSKSEKKFVVLDSISTLFVYNKEKSTEKFIHALISKINEFNSIGVLLAVSSKEYLDKINNLSQFCDKIVQVKFK